MKWNWKVNNHFKNEISPKLGYNISSYISYFEILKSSECDRIASIEEFCEYQDLKQERNQWNIGLYLLE